MQVEVQGALLAAARPGGPQPRPAAEPGHGCQRLDLPSCPLRTLPASPQVLCSDKTGTLTLNRLTLDKADIQVGDARGCQGWWWVGGAEAGWAGGSHGLRWTQPAGSAQAGACCRRCARPCSRLCWVTRQGFPRRRPRCAAQGLPLTPCRPAAAPCPCQAWGSFTADDVLLMASMSAKWSNQVGWV